MTARTALGILMTCTMLWGCDRQQSDVTDAKSVAQTEKSDSSEIDAYLKQFSGGDPETCFEDAALATTTFQSSEGSIAPVPPVRVIVAVDASGSMAGRVSSRAKIDLAKTAAAAFVEELPANADAGLLVFGQAGNNMARGKAQSCGSVELAVPMGRDRASLVRSVSSIRPVGWTPLAAALRRAETLLSVSGRAGEQVIYVVSDGQETCGGDPVAAARAINQGKTRAIVNIIGFAVPSGEAASLAAVAAAGGGRFINASSADQVDAIAARNREEARKTVNSLRHSATTTNNNLATASAAATARLCTGSIIAKERLAVGADLAKKRIAGRNVALEESAERIMNQRHAALERRAQKFIQSAEGKRDLANDAVDKAASKSR